MDKQQTSKCDEFECIGCQSFFSSRETRYYRYYRLKKRMLCANCDELFVPTSMVYGWLKHIRDLLNSIFEDRLLLQQTDVIKYYSYIDRQLNRLDSQQWDRVFERNKTIQFDQIDDAFYMILRTYSIFGLDDEEYVNFARTFYFETFSCYFFLAIDHSCCMYDELQFIYYCVQR